ncbi:hypothetical protein B0F90DRAFT_1708367, partial [Multifurca ochricompacta]
FRKRSTLTSKNVTKATKQALNGSALNFLKAATSRRARPVPAKTRRATELRLVNSILDEQCFPAAVENGFQVSPMMAQLEEGILDRSLAVSPGTLVEVRWKSFPLIGVILREVHNEGRNGVQTLMVDGRIITHLAHDILYAVPKFIDPFHIKRCGVEDTPVNSKELMARISVAEKVRAFSKSAEGLFNGYSALAPDEEAWASVTVAEAAKLLNVQHLDHNLVLHAVYSRLMKHSQMFVVDSHNFLSSQTFYVRPRAQVDRFDRVRQLMRTSSPRVKQFAMRAKETIAELRKMSTNFKNHAPSYSPAMNLAFTEDDQLFIRFFLDSLVDIRSVQTDPYTPLICDIIKGLGLYKGDVDSAQVRQFLVDLGVLPPWQDIASLREAQPALTAATPKAIPPVVKGITKSVATSPDLGPDDLYPSDPLESIRHDFGQLTVYTIDDYGAQELDDGISVERDASDPSNLWVHVHVADPTSILPPTHTIARRACDATHTLYFHHSSRPMLPDSLGHAALNGKPENVMTFSAKVDSNGDIVDYKVRPGIVRNVRILKYDDVDAAMSFDSNDTTFPFGRTMEPTPTPPNLTIADIENIRLLDLFSKRVVARRLSTSTFSYGLRRAELNVSPKPLPVGAVDLIQPGLFLGGPQISYSVRGPMPSGSRQIVAEAAQVANRVASLFGRDHEIPLMRRSLAAPVGNEEVIADLLKLRDKNGWVDFFDPAEHWTLGVAEGEGYTRATSPLRRYGDLVTHWQIKHALLHNEPLFSTSEMQTTFNNIGAKEHRWKWLEQSHRKWWALSFVKRWKESGRDTGTYNSVKTMIGRVTARARQDIFRGTWVQEVHIPYLGLFGILEGAEVEQEIGAEVAMTVDKIMLTAHPMLRLKPKHGYS